MPKIEKLRYARSLKLQAAVEASSRIHPDIAQAAQDGCLSSGTLSDLASTNGIPLACDTNPVVVITPLPPPRHVKYHVPTKPPRLKRRLLPAHVEFEGGEHTAIGDSAFLYFSPNDPGVIAAQVPLTLPNGLQLTYGQIVALAGDFYGVPGAPISDGTTPADIMTRFTNAYNTLAVDIGAVTDAPNILQVMQTEITAVNQALANGQSASSAYDALGDSLSEQWNRITGGGSVFSPWIPMGRYLQLAAVNWDHFGEHAITAYTYGHTVAMQQGMLARNAPPAQQMGLLVQAYAMNAFADHFLSDAFSAGHVRAPRKQLYETVTPNQVGSYLSRYMHDEDSHWGLNLLDAANTPWHAYGDKRYFDTVDVANKAAVDSAVQLSVDEIFYAFNNGVITPTANLAALQLTPTPIGSARNPQNEQAAGNISPLFSWDGSAMLRRNDINNLNDYSWTSSWWGWSTLALIQKSYAPNPPQGYLQRPTTAPAISASGWQSAQSVPPNWVSGAQVHYAVSFLTSLYQSDLGPWCAYLTVGPNQAYPTLTGVPTGPAGTLARGVYRQFTGGWYTPVGWIQDNTTTAFIDNTP